MPLFRRVHCPAVLNSILLYPVARNRIPRQLEPNEVRHHAAAGEVTSSLLVVAGQVGKPAHSASFHGHGSGSDGVSADILVESRANEIRNDADRIGRWSN